MVTSSLVIRRAGMACPNSCKVTVTKKANPSNRTRAMIERNSNMFGVLLSKIGKYCRNSCLQYSQTLTILKLLLMDGIFVWVSQQNPERDRIVQNRPRSWSTSAEN